MSELEKSKDWNDLCEIIHGAQKSYNQQRNFTDVQWIALKVIQCCFTRHPQVERAEVSEEKIAEIIFYNSMHVGTWADFKKLKDFKNSGCMNIAHAIKLAIEEGRV